MRVDSCIILLLLVYKCVTGTILENLNIKYKKPNCRSHEYLMLEVKQVNTKYGQRTFDYVGPVCRMCFH